MSRDHQSPTPQPNWDHLRQAIQEHIQIGFERGLHNLSELPVAVLHHSHHKEVSPTAEVDPPVLYTVLTVSCPITRHHQKETISFILTPTPHIYIH